MIDYTIDTKNKKIANEEHIYSSPEVENGWSGFRLFNDYYSTKPERYLVFQAEAYEHDDSGIGTELANDMMVYDIEKNKLVKLDVPEDLNVDFDKVSIVNSSMIAPVYSENGVKVMQYDIETQKWDEKQTFEIVNMKSDTYAPFIQIMNEKIYTVQSTEDGHRLVIGDLLTGESLYEGNIVVKNQNKDDYKLYIYDIEE